MSFTEVIIEIAREHAESLSDALMEAGALSVSVEDADEGTEDERPLFGEPGMVIDQAYRFSTEVTGPLNAVGDKGWGTAVHPQPLMLQAITATPRENIAHIQVQEIAADGSSQTLVSVP